MGSNLMSQRLEHSQRVQALRERVRRSLDDPEPSLTAEAAEAEMERAKTKLKQIRPNAPTT